MLQSFDFLTEIITIYILYIMDWTILPTRLSIERDQLTSLSPYVGYA